MYVHNDRITAIIDTGASINIMAEAIYKTLKRPPPLQKARVRVFAYGQQEPLKMTGVFETPIRHEGRRTISRIYVAKDGHGMLLSGRTAEALGLIHFALSVHASELDTILEEHSEIFQGIGCLKAKAVKLHIDSSVQPVALRHRRIAFHLRPKVEEELQKLEDQGIIERVDGPTPWVSPIVVTRKPKQPGEVRICVDMRIPNVAIKRERHLTPTVDDIVSDLSGASWFSKMDLRAGYHQLPLHPDSRYITTFSTHVGLRRYKRLSFGISSAAEVFQNTIREVLAGIPGVVNVSDDILVYATTAKEHNQRLLKVLERIKKAGLTLHREKCEFLKRTISFFGYVSRIRSSPGSREGQGYMGSPRPNHHY